MKVEIAIVTAVVGALYLIVTKYLPDFPVSAEVFQVVILFLLAKLGIEVSGTPADALRKMLG